MPAHRHRGHAEGKLGAANTADRPMGTRGEHLDHVLELLHVRRTAPTHAQYELEPERRIQQSIINQPYRVPDMSRLEAFDLRFHSGGLHANRKLTQERGRVDEDPFAKIDRPAV